MLDANIVPTENSVSNTLFLANSTPLMRRDTGHSGEKMPVVRQIPAGRCDSRVSMVDSSNAAGA
jgi:hypothetical protein